MEHVWEAGRFHRPWVIRVVWAAINFPRQIFDCQLFGQVVVTGTVQATQRQIAIASQKSDGAKTTKPQGMCASQTFFFLGACDL